MGEFGESGMPSDKLGVGEGLSQPESELARRGKAVIDILSGIIRGRVAPGPEVFADWVTDMMSKIREKTNDEGISGVLQVNGYADAQIDYGGRRIGDREFVGRYLEAFGAYVPVTRLGGAKEDSEVGWNNIGWIADNAANKMKGIHLTDLPADFVGAVKNQEGKTEWLVMGTKIEGVRLVIGGSSVSNLERARGGGVVDAQAVFLIDSGLGHDKTDDLKPDDSPLIGWEPIL